MLLAQLGIDTQARKRTYVVLARPETCFGCLSPTLEALGLVVQGRPQEAQAVVALFGDSKPAWAEKPLPGLGLANVPAHTRSLLPLEGLPQLLVFGQKGKLLAAQLLPPTRVSLEHLESFFFLEEP